MPSLFTFANNISTTLAGAISTGATSLTLSSAANLPSSIPAGKVLAIALNDVATRQQFEVIYATAISGATLSGLLRGQEGTAAQAWSTGDYAYAPPTKGQMEALGQLADSNTWSGTNAFTNPVPVGAATAPGHAMQFGQLPGQFPSSLTSSGWKKYPDPNSPSGYMIEQWGVGSITSLGAGNTPQPFNLPIAYPNAHLSAMAGYNGNAPGGALGAIAAQEYTLNQVLVTIYTSGAVSNAAIKYWSKGY
ncbi:gp53-like domain-containing protein [Burkholderia vietnamiensis]|uniref:gp53-like domain-containing protein n=1 Tax=Burkholderia vietnamiensis TaxID=60552 RepID=UPI00352E0E7E